GGPDRGQVGEKKEKAERGGEGDFIQRIASLALRPGSTRPSLRVSLSICLLASPGAPQVGFRKGGPQSSLALLPVVRHLGNVLALEQPGHQLACTLALHLGVGPKDDAVRAPRLRERIDVVRTPVSPALHGRQRLARVEKVDRASRAGSKRDLGVAPGAADE